MSTTITLKLNFADNADARKFLHFLAYLQYCGSIGHSTGITVNADGDGSFKMRALMEDPSNGQFKNVQDILQIPPGFWVEKKMQYRKQNEKNTSAGLKGDRNEIAFNLGD